MVDDEVGKGEHRREAVVLSVYKAAKKSGLRPVAECVELFTLPDILPLADRPQGSSGLPTPASMITFTCALLQLLFYYQTQGAHIRTGRYSIPKLQTRKSEHLCVREQ